MSSGSNNVLCTRLKRLNAVDIKILESFKNFELPTTYVTVSICCNIHSKHIFELIFYLLTSKVLVAASDCNQFLIAIDKDSLVKQD